ncbi:pentatricopeptide repeat-containing protein At3g13160, mitochondrial-like [Argentina anserina]|uniref:pentatricopeptide repeat-containing protein At3g13160, mitochondrial-like n=1 Tax=Argentina anserina TaxID=57926 RepID=UPI00217668AB|nr:pentatricopeptide repeat-containing protein At3g13160, mitochondrial-like [Potentilla anserina]
MSFARLLRRAFSTTTTTTTLPKPTAAVKSIRAISQDLYTENNLKLLVKKFKESSEIYRFRTKSPVYEETVRRLATAKRFEAIEEILEHQKKYPDFSEEGFTVRILSLYGKAGMFDNAKKVFDEMPERNCARTVLSFNALMGACVSCKKFEMVGKIFEEVMRELSVEPDVVSYNILIKAFCEMGKFDDAVAVIETMEEKGAVPDVITFNTLLDCLYGNQRFSEAEKIWGQMVEKNVVPVIRSYNARLMGLALEKRSQEAAQLFEELKNIGLKPDVFSFNALIKGSVNEGNLDEAKRWYGEIEKSGCRPARWTFGTLVPFVCEKGDMEYAFELCKDIFKSRRVVSATLLQPVVNGLVKASMIEQAKELVRLGNTNSYKRFDLKLPSDE